MQKAPRGRESGPSRPPAARDDATMSTPEPSPPDSVLVYLGEALRRYAFGGDHPFGPDRLDAFRAEFDRQGIAARVRIGEPVATGREALERFHTAAYVDRVIAGSQSGSGFLDYGDTPAFRGVYEAAAIVVGTTLDACERLLAGECRRAFSPIAGLHHGRRDAASGFCVFNDVGVVVETLRAVHGLDRIAYVDIDAHHGDGVYYEFESAPWLFVADFHEDGRYLYPGTGHPHEQGTGEAAGTKINVAVPPGGDDAAFHREWPRVEEFLRQARPQFVLLQCGADSIAGDPITHLRYSPDVHAHVARRLAAIADEACDGRLLAMGGGGYNRRNLALAWTGVVRALVESTPAAGAAGWG